VQIAVALGAEVTGVCSTRIAGIGSPAGRSSGWPSRGCLLKAPAIVILDEATAHLDSESEVAVQPALAAALQAGRRW
jgi:hypothetical protein